MLFEWDEDKNRANIQKHRIDFADIPAIFSGPMVVELDEREDYGEERWISIGFLRNIVIRRGFTMKSVRSPESFIIH